MGLVSFGSLPRNTRWLKLYIDIIIDMFGWSLLFKHRALSNNLNVQVKIWFLSNLYNSLLHVDIDSLFYLDNTLSYVNGAFHRLDKQIDKPI